MPDPLTAAANMVVPGWKTSEFWSHLAVQAGIGLLTFLIPHASGLPPLAQGIITGVGPLAMAYLQSQYSEDRSAVKMAAMAAPQAKAAP